MPGAHYPLIWIQIAKYQWLYIYGCKLFHTWLTFQRGVEHITSHPDSVMSENTSWLVGQPIAITSLVLLNDWQLIKAGQLTHGMTWYNTGYLANRSSIVSKVWCDSIWCSDSRPGEDITSLSSWCKSLFEGISNKSSETLWLRMSYRLQTEGSVSTSWLGLHP